MKSSQRIPQVVEKGGFDSFLPSIGSKVTLELNVSDRRYHVELLGYAKNKSIMVSAPHKQGKEQLLALSEPLVARLLVRNRVLAFESKVIYRSVNPFSYYHLEYPKTVTSSKIRDSERVQLSLPVQIYSEFDAGVGEWPKQASFKNISKQGAAILTSSPLGVLGHEIILKFQLNVENFQKVIAVPAIIKNIEPPVLGGNRTQYGYGVHFQFTNPQDALMLMSFVYAHTLGVMIDVPDDKGVGPDV